MWMHFSNELRLLFDGDFASGLNDICGCESHKGYELNQTQFF